MVERDWFENLGTADEPIPPHLEPYVTKVKHVLGPYYILVDEDGKYYRGMYSIGPRDTLRPSFLYDTEKGARMGMRNFPRVNLKVFKVTFGATSTKEMGAKNGREEEPSSATSE